MTRPASPHSSAKRKAQPPLLPTVVGHGLFPVLTGLWFAALLGLCGVVASADALASLVVHLHLPSVLHAASPPLGSTAHILVSLGLALLGGVFGLALGLVLQRRLGVARPRKIVAEDEVIDEAPAVARPMADPVADEAPRVRSRDAHPDAPPRRPLVVTQDVLPYAPEAVVEAKAPEPVVIEPASIEPTVRGEVDEEGMIHPPAWVPAWVAAELARSAEPEPADLPFAPEPHAAPEHLPPFLAAAYAATQEPEIEPVPEPEPAVVAPLATQAITAPQAPIAAAPLASLGLVQLIERLALAIAERQVHREGGAPLMAMPATAAPADAPLHRFDPLTMDPTGPLLRAKPQRTPKGDTSDQTVGHLHDPLAEHWADEWHEGEAETLPPRFLGTAEHDEPEPEEAEPEDLYSSLADMALPRPVLVEPDRASHDPVPFVPRLARLVTESATNRDPVVPFPLASARISGAEPASESQAPDADAGSSQADRALREALATLRRMSAQR